MIESKHWRANGDYYNPHVSIGYYKLDSVDEVADPSMWLKANPNLGKNESKRSKEDD